MLISGLPGVSVPRNTMPLYGRLSAVGKMKTTAINIPVDTWTMPRAVAFARAQETGGRPSVSALITELAEQHRAELEKEAGV